MSGHRGGVGVFPGTFNPPTVAHLAVAEEARTTLELERVDLVVSRIPIGKEHLSTPSLDQRVEVLERLAGRVGWMRIVVSEQRLIVDIAAGYDVVIMGADKWGQVNDPVYYGGDSARRDDAVARLPRLALFDRADVAFNAGVRHITEPDAVTLRLEARYLDVSSSAARAGASHLMVPEALESGLWS
ncbi:MAG TPA: hypothetical protein PLP95_03555 [Microthrixaceae bacterium]|nr:hypothetical protein [Microthrixaceae bacterium]